MDKTKEKVVQYLSEAHATEQALVTMLQSQIAMTPRGSYRDGLESHLRQTRDHASRVQRRLDELGQGASPIISEPNSARRNANIRALATPIGG